MNVESPPIDAIIPFERSGLAYIIGSEGMPHVGHADSIMNDEHGSRSDIFDWSSSYPIARVIKVTLPTLAISLYNHSYIHTRIHCILPCPPGDSNPESPGGSRTKHRTSSEMHNIALCCVTKRQLPHSTRATTEPEEKNSNEPHAALA